MSTYENTTSFNCLKSSNMELSFEDENIQNFVKIWPLEEDLRPGLLKLQVDKYFACRWPNGKYIVNPFSQTRRSIPEPELSFTYMESAGINSKLDRVEIGANNFVIPIIKFLCMKGIDMDIDRYILTQNRGSSKVSNNKNLTNTTKKQRKRELRQDKKKLARKKKVTRNKEDNPRNLSNNPQTIAPPNKLNKFASLTELRSQIEKANPNAEFALDVSVDKNCKPRRVVIPDDRFPRRSKILLESSASEPHESEVTSPNLSNNPQTIGPPNKLHKFASLAELRSQIEKANPNAEFVLDVSVDKNCKPRRVVIPDDRFPRRSKILLESSASEPHESEVTSPNLSNNPQTIGPPNKLHKFASLAELRSQIEKANPNAEFVLDVSVDKNCKPRRVVIPDDRFPRRSKILLESSASEPHESEVTSPNLSNNPPTIGPPNKLNKFASLAELRSQIEKANPNAEFVLDVSVDKNCKPRRVVIPDDRFPRRSKILLESSASEPHESEVTSPNLSNNPQTIGPPNKLNKFASLAELRSQIEKANPNAEFVLDVSVDKNCKPRRVVIPDDRFPRRSKILLESSASEPHESEVTSPNLSNNPQTIGPPNKLHKFASLAELRSQIEKANPNAEFVLDVSVDKNCKPRRVVIPDDRFPRRSKILLESSASEPHESEVTSPNLSNNPQTIAPPNKLNKFASLAELRSQIEKANPNAEFVLAVSVDKNWKPRIVEIPDDRFPQRSKRLLESSASVSNNNQSSQSRVDLNENYQDSKSLYTSLDNKEVVSIWLSQPSDNKFNKITRQSKIEDFFKVIRPRKSKARQLKIPDFFEVIKSTRSKKKLSQDKNNMYHFTTKQRFKSQGVQTVIESESIHIPHDKSKSTQSQGVQTHNFIDSQPIHIPQDKSEVIQPTQKDCREIIQSTLSRNVCTDHIAKSKSVQSDNVSYKKKTRILESKKITDTLKTSKSVQLPHDKSNVINRLNKKQGSDKASKKNDRKTELQETTKDLTNTLKITESDESSQAKSEKLKTLPSKRRMCKYYNKRFIRQRKIRYYPEKKQSTQKIDNLKESKSIQSDSFFECQGFHLSDSEFDSERSDYETREIQIKRTPGKIVLTDAESKYEFGQPSEDTSVEMNSPTSKQPTKSQKVLTALYVNDKYVQSSEDTSVEMNSPTSKQPTKSQKVLTATYVNDKYVQSSEDDSDASAVLLSSYIFNQMHRRRKIDPNFISSGYVFKKKIQRRKIQDRPKVKQSKQNKGILTHTVGKTKSAALLKFDKWIAFEDRKNKRHLN